MSKKKADAEKQAEDAQVLRDEQDAETAFQQEQMDSGFGVPEPLPFPEPRTPEPEPVGPTPDEAARKAAARVERDKASGVYPGLTPDEADVAHTGETVETAARRAAERIANAEAAKAERAKQK